MEAGVWAEEEVGEGTSRTGAEGDMMARLGVLGHMMVVLARERLGKGRLWQATGTQRDLYHPFTAVYGRPVRRWSSRL